MRRIGVLMGFAENNSRSHAHMAAFGRGLRELGWTESRNVRIDIRWAALATAVRGNNSRRSSSHCGPISFFRAAHPPCGVAAANAHHPHHFRDRYRSGRQRLRREPPAAWRQRHRFHPCRADNGRQMGGTAQGDCATRQPGRDAVQPGNGDICRLFPEALPRRRTVLRSGGNRSPCSRHVRTRDPSMLHRYTSRMAALS